MGIQWVFPASILIAASWAYSRDQSEIRAFRNVEPCPSTGLYRGPCNGWQVDHITPLCAGGEDRYWNMQWIRTEDHKMKTHVDTRECKKIGKPPGMDKLLRQ